MESSPQGLPVLADKSKGFCENNVGDWKRKSAKALSHSQNRQEEPTKATTFALLDRRIVCDICK